MITRDWRPMKTAPRDGTPIEIKNTYGVAPWYGLVRWSSTQLVHSIRRGADGTRIDEGLKEQPCKPCWASLDRPSSWKELDDSFTWRPYLGNPSTYVDPTNGDQETEEYWQRACGLYP